MTISDKNQALIDLVTRFVGVQETTPNDGPEIRIFQSIISKPMHQAWCVDFVQYCLAEVDKNFSTKHQLFVTESSHLLWANTPPTARIAVPEPGCIIVWQHYNNETPLSTGHAGIVREVLDSQFVMTVEGNTTGSAVVDNQGDGVYMKRRHIAVNTGPMRVLGFLLPWFA